MEIIRRASRALTVDRSTARAFIPGVSLGFLALGASDGLRGLVACGVILAFLVPAWTLMSWARLTYSDFELVEEREGHFVLHTDGWFGARSRIPLEQLRIARTSGGVGNYSYSWIDLGGGEDPALWLVARVARGR